MHIRNLNLIIMLIAGIIVTLISIISSYTIDRLMYTLLIVLVLFFIIGSTIQGLLNAIAHKADVKAREREKAELEKETEILEDDTSDSITTEEDES